MKKYFIHNDQESLGPFTVEELAAMEITKYTPVWCDGLPGWTPAMHVRELKSLWSDKEPFVYTAVPPAFDKSAYEHAVKDGAQPLLKVAPRERGLGSPVFWVGLVALATTVIVALSFRYHQRTVNQTYMTALEQRKWEDSLDKEMGAAAVSEPELQNDTTTSALVGAPDEAFERTRREYALNYTRMNIERYLRAAKTFDVKRFGGIKDAKVAVYNNSDFPIDRADVQVVYIKANGEVFKSQTISLTNIPAHGKREAAVPDEKRGTDLRCTLKRVTDAELGVSKNLSILF